jgi:NTE family protein
MRDIADRRNELSGNVSLNKELDMIETVNAMFDKGHLKGTNYRHIIVRIVGIEEEESNLDLSHASKFDRSPEFLRALFDRGRERAPEFYKPTSLRDEVTHRIRRSRLPLR